MQRLETVRLQQSGDRWFFQAEQDLEEFLWLKGEEIFGWRWLARQFAIDGQFCDLLAVDESGSLVVVELKNEEEKCIVSQLTRYFHALAEDRPFVEQVDYARPIRLVAIAPSFHRHSLTDRLYSLLHIEFFECEIIGHFETCCEFRDLDSTCRLSGKITIPHSSPEHGAHEISDIPKKLLGPVIK